MYRPNHDKKNGKSYLEVFGRIEGVYIQYHRTSFNVYSIHRYSVYKNSRKHGISKILNINGKIDRIETYINGELTDVLFAHQYKCNDAWSLICKTLNQDM